jgi:DNA primase
LSSTLNKKESVMRIWVNFKELRSKIKFEDVLRHYGITVQKKGVQHQGFCPLPGHEGNKRSPSFNVNLEKGIFHCFGCGAKGNVLEFAVLMKGGTPEDGDALRAAAVELQQLLLPDAGDARKPGRGTQTPAHSLPVVVNHPLNFELKDLDRAHPYLLGRGFTPEIVGHFGLGFCSRGMLKGRVAIPLHGKDGKLLGFGGRVVDDATITDENPRYLLPGRREHSGTIYEFKKSLVVYNGHRISTPADDLAVVEGFASVWWLTQHGFPRTVATMGSECSIEQSEIIVSLVKPSGRIWLVPDGDKAGERFAETMLPQIAPSRFTRWLRLGNGRQPTDLSPRELKDCFTT